MRLPPEWKTNEDQIISYDKAKIEAIAASVDNCFTSVIDKNIDWSDEQKMRVKKRLQEVRNTREV